MTSNYILVIVESPAKCSKIESYLGEGYKCVASFGHLRELKGLESIAIEANFKPTFIESENKLKQISKIRALLKNASEVLLATDDDREGEAIAWHLCDMFGLPLKTTKRIIFHEITETALKNAVKNPTYVNMAVVNAQLARQILDLFVGYKLSPLLWKNIAKHTKNGLSAGRCQTPALRLVYDNQKEIESSPGCKVYHTIGYFTSKNIPFQLNHQHEDADQMTAFLEASVNHVHLYTCGTPRNTTKAPPTPFTTSSLQQMASNEMRLSPKETMQICQKLYEGGHITYMRTDSKTYSAEFIANAATFITTEYGKEYISSTIEQLALRTGGTSEKDSEEKLEDKKPKNKKNKKELSANNNNKNNIQEAHEAIRPTNLKCKQLDLKEYTPKEIKMYLLIRRNTLESCMPPATYKSLTAFITAPQKEAEYKYSVEQVVFPGWQIVAGYESENKEYMFLQTLKNGIPLDYKKITTKVSMKNIKAHYTEARLVQLLEQEGIGRPSTFSSLIDKIQERGYVKKDNVKGVMVECVDFELVGEELCEIAEQREFGNEKNKLVLQPLGTLVLEFLLKHFDPLFQYTYTKQMEDALDQIAKGDKTWHELCRTCLDEIDTLHLALNTSASSYDDTTKFGEIKIDAEHTYMMAKYGPVIKCTLKNNKVSFKPVRPDIDLNKLKKGEYALSDLILENKLTGRALGEYNGHEIILKKGKYGLYVEWGDAKQAVKLKKTQTEEDLTREDIIELLTSTSSTTSASTTSSTDVPLIQAGVLRPINENMSIRNGKFGDYIFYKKKTMKQPKFLKLNGFTENYKECDISILKDWIKNTYDL